MKTQNKIGPLSRRGLFSPDTFNDEDKSIEVVFATENPVVMYNYQLGTFKEILSMDPAHIRLKRFQRGISLLDNHDRHGSVKKVVLGAAIYKGIEKNEGICRAILSEREDNQGLILDVKKGIIKETSVGYRVFKYEELTLPGEEMRTLKAIDWEPFELSLTPVGNDEDSMTRSKKNNEENEFEIISREDSLKTRSQEADPAAEPVIVPAPVVTEPVAAPVEVPAAVPVLEVEPVANPVDHSAAIASEQARCLEINDSCRRLGLKDEFARKLVTDKTPIENARKLIINQKAEENGSMNPNTNVTVVADERDAKRGLAEKAISLRLGLFTGTVENEVGALRHLTLTELAKEINPALRSMSKKEIAQRSMHSTSDFPLLFGNVANKSLAKAYAVAPKTFLPFVNKVNLSDYKESSKIKFGEAPELKAIAEGGEYEFGTIGEGSEKMKLSKYGRKIRITEEMFINDDLGALASLPVKFGNASARLESALVYGILTGNPNMADGVALFHANHGNLGTAGAPSETTFDEMVQKFLEQAEGGQLLNILPKFVIGGPKNRTQLMKMIASLSAVGKSGDVNIFQNAYDLIIDANITNKLWFGAADPSQIETIDIGYLDGMEGPEVKSIADEANDSILLKCKHVFVAKAVESKGLFKNPYV
jgi:hypothetical protein